VIAESSRILVPFKKTLNDLLSKQHPADTHPFYWSKNSLLALLICAGFEPVQINRYFDSDSIVIIARKLDSIPDPNMLIPADDPEVVSIFFTKYIEFSKYFESLR
jgi:hypothetical protein